MKKSTIFVEGFLEQREHIRHNVMRKLHGFWECLFGHPGVSQSSPQSRACRNYQKDLAASGTFLASSASTKPSWLLSTPMYLNPHKEWPQPWSSLRFPFFFCVRKRVCSLKTLKKKMDGIMPDSASLTYILIYYMNKINKDSSSPWWLEYEYEYGRLSSIQNLTRNMIFFIEQCWNLNIIYPDHL